MSSNEGISGHFCGQQQPHAAHIWQTPQVYGSTSVVGTYQCGGLVLAGHRQFTDGTGTWCYRDCSMPDAECGQLAVEQNA